MDSRSPSVATGSPASSRASTRNSLQPPNAREIPPSRPPRVRSVSQVTTPGSVLRRELRPLRPRAKAEDLARSRLCPALTGALAHSPLPTRQLLPGALRPQLRWRISGFRWTEMTRPTRRGGALELLPRLQPRPFPDLRPQWSLHSSDLHLSCCSVRLRPVGGGEPLLQIVSTKNS